MAVSASLHRNILLLNQLVPPSDEFKKVFREGMFDKPNIAGFIHVSQYLLTIYDAERFKKLIEWPIICKKSEAKYRNDVKDYLNVIASENPDIGFPNILITYLHHASGTKFTIIMWKLSQLAVKKYLIRQGEQVTDAPKVGPANDLTKTYLQQSKIDIARDVSSRHRSCAQMESAVNIALTEEKEQLAKVKAELFDRKQSLVKHAAAAPVAASIKERLVNVEDTEVIKMWKKSIDDNICYIQKRYAILKDFEKTCENISSIMSNLSSDAEVLDGRQLEKVDCSRLLELPFPPEIQHCLYHLYDGNKLRYRNFIHLFTLMLRQVYQCLRKRNLVDLSQCQLQVEASVEDLRSVYNVFNTFLTSIVSSTEEAQSVLCERNVGRTSEEDVLPLVKNVLLMPSPLIKINTHYVDEKDDLHKLLQFTPAEVAHKSLFSRYMRHDQNQAPDLRMNLFVSRINVDDAVSSSYSEKPSTRFMTPRVNRLCKKTTGKYSRLFSTCVNKTAKANYSLMSLPSTTKANSSAITSATGEMPNLSDLNLDITPRGFFSSTEDPATPLKRNILKEMPEEKLKDERDREVKVNKPDLDEFTEIQFATEKNVIVKHENAHKRRRSISDLVERYKKLLEASNTVATNFQSECTEYEVE
ncbi:uncharacterized protein LOC105279589 isoform X2 [Ooceraea biroi]|uniref:HAUS augmin-like complex subunit 6 N-terminal domain-containing protein n=1 Tax=Ooceraea biroi TaxID=2015173 RepID=A0A026WGV7_OOCBI|nr:uncharacterized protein LOC105279589 isoform X2 [Ooceraea biroi]EZA54921.1 hypothetical protein X777_05339 [Ooceraea biroi]